MFCITRLILEPSTVLINSLCSESESAGEEEAQDGRETSVLLFFIKYFDCYSVHF